MEGSRTMLRYLPLLILFVLIGCHDETDSSDPKGQLLRNEVTEVPTNGVDEGAGTIEGAGADQVAIPEPGTLALIGMGVAGFAAYKVRKKRG